MAGHLLGAKLLFVLNTMTYRTFSLSFIIVIAIIVIAIIIVIIFHS